MSNLFFILVKFARSRCALLASIFISFMFMLPMGGNWNDAHAHGRFETKTLGGITMIKYINDSLSLKNVSIGPFDMIQKDSRNLIEFKRILIADDDSKPEREPTRGTSDSNQDNTTNKGTPKPIEVSMTEFAKGIRFICPNSTLLYDFELEGEPTWSLLPASSVTPIVSSDTAVYMRVFDDPGNMLVAMPEIDKSAIADYIVEQTGCTKRAALALLSAESDFNFGAWNGQAYSCMQLMIYLHYDKMCDSIASKLNEDLPKFGVEATAAQCKSYFNSNGFVNEAAAIIMATVYWNDCVNKGKNATTKRARAGKAYMYYAAGLGTTANYNSVLRSHQPSSIYAHVSRYLSKYDHIPE